MIKSTFANNLNSSLRWIFPSKNHSQKNYLQYYSLN